MNIPCPASPRCGLPAVFHAQSEFLDTRAAGTLALKSAATLSVGTDLEDTQ